MNTVTLHATRLHIDGMTPDDIEEMHRDFAQYDIVRRVERWSIRDFMRENAHLLEGKVLDYGCGERPYEHLVKGAYVPYSPETDTTQMLAMLNGSVDTVICNQVVQYVQNPGAMLQRFRVLLRPHGYVVMTFPTNWDEVEDTDLHRFTAAGMRKLLHDNDFEVIRCERRAQIAISNFNFPLGYGIVVRR